MSMSFPYPAQPQLHGDRHIYQSMFGSTRQMAEAIAEGLRGAMVVSIIAAPEVGTVGLVNPDLLVVGAPTHAHGMPRQVTRRATPIT